MIKFRKADPAEIQENAIDLIGNQWMLITAGNLASYNTMTASWGSLGMLWNKPVVFVFVRPQRYTFGFMESGDRFTCCFFGEEYRNALRFCGSNSGRDFDKAKETGLSPAETESGSVFFAESKLILECSKLYYQDLTPEGFLQASIQKNYPLNDFHRMYVGEITNCLVQDK